MSIAKIGFTFAKKHLKSLRSLKKAGKGLKKTGKAISTDGIDKLYEIGINAGALGGKLLGAGGGGFLVFYVQPEKQEMVKNAMKDLLYIPFEFENDGTSIIYYDPEEYEKVGVE